MGRPHGRRQRCASRLRLAGLFCLLAAMASGCWDRREIETVAVATAIALDLPAAREGLLLTAQFSIPARTMGAAAGAGGGGGMTGPGSGLSAPFARTTGGPSGPTAWVVGAAGSTLTEAVERITRLSPRLPIWAHLRLIVVGEEVARQGLGGVLDALLRERQFRRTPWIVVAHGIPGYRILELPNPISPSAEEGMTRLLEILQGYTADALPVRLQDFLTAVAEPGIDPVVAGMTYALPVPHSPQLTPSSEQLPAFPQPLGAALFRDDRMVGWLSAEQTRALALLMGQSRIFRLIAPCPQGTGVVVLRVVRFQTSRTVRLLAGAGGGPGGAGGSQIPAGQAGATAGEGGAGAGRRAGGAAEGGGPAAMPEFRVRVDADAAVNEQSCHPPLNLASVRLLERQASRALEADMRKLLRRLHHELRVDPVGLGRQLFRREPRWWAEHGPRWRELLPRLPVDVKVRLFVRRTGIATGRLEPQP